MLGLCFFTSIKSNVCKVVIVLKLEYYKGIINFLLRFCKSVLNLEKTFMS